MPSGKEPIIVPARGCKFIAGDPRQRGWSYCGETLAGPESSWCEEHHALVYGRTPPKPRPPAEPANTGAAKSPPSAPQLRGSLEDPMLLG